MPQAQWVPFSCLAAAFIVNAGVVALLRPPPHGWRLLLMPFVTIAIFGIVFLGIIVTKTDFSRSIIIAMFASAVVLVPGAYIVGSFRYRFFALGSLIIAVIVASTVSSVTRQISTHDSVLIKTEYYNLKAETYRGAFPKSAVHGGALARIGDHYLLMVGDGHLYAFGWNHDHLDVTSLPYRIPVNGNAFAAVAQRPWVTPPAEGANDEVRRYARKEILNTEWFRTYGLLVQESGSKIRVFASHDFWVDGRNCWVERVSELEADRAAFLRGTASPTWTTLFETTPCLPTRGGDRRRGIPFVGYFGGGRMALLDAETLLLTVGDFGFDGLASVEIQAQDPATSYGKTVAINIRDGRTTLFTLGHRNPQGLYIDRSGTVWSTEHGPQGGDELNRLVKGGNYGWPYATYGTDYGSFSWPLNKPEPEQQHYTAPIFAWVPSVATSNLIGIERDLFSQWRGNLLIASLKAKSLFRAPVVEGHIAYVEPILIGHRIRDLIEGHDGRIILWTDDDTLISLRPEQGTTGEALFAQKCSGCHQSTQVGGDRIGPNLSGVVGRKIASLKSYPDYSAAMRQLGGVWTEKQLDAFLKAPRDLCPGTAMDFNGVVSAQERNSIIGYLRTLRS